MTIVADENNRGYTPYQEETLSPQLQTVGDTKEGLYFGREVPKGDPEANVPLHGPNQWPDPSQLPLFRPTVMRYYEACTQVAFRFALSMFCGKGTESEGAGVGRRPCMFAM
jgi:isopenicillin N synthase-like dioxygenase